MSTNEEDELFKECVLNALKNQELKMKIFNMVIYNSNNFMEYFVFSSKSEEVEFGYEFMIIDGYKVIFKWSPFPNRYL
jgi:hypothetical protein